MNGIRPVDVNPTGITTFDHEALAVLREYWPAVRVLWDLRRAVVAAGVDMPWEEWLATVHAVVAAPFFVDVCPRCLGSRVPPYAATVRGDRLTGLYPVYQVRAWLVVCVGDVEPLAAWLEAEAHLAERDEMRSTTPMSLVVARVINRSAP